MSRAVPLHFTEAFPKLAGGAASRHVRFLFLHGFLAHSGSLNSLVMNLRRQIDSYNSSVLMRHADAASVVDNLIDSDMVSIDARNHGLSPHASVHALPDLAADLGQFLRRQSCGFDPSLRTPAVAQPPQEKSRRAPKQTLTVAIGHSMGSCTLAYYLMEQQALHNSGACSHAGSERLATVGYEKLGVVARTPAALLQGRIDAMVALDMPPVTAKQIPDRLTDELTEMVRGMEQVNLSNITDLRTAHDEFLRCGMTAMRMRGFCSTNLLMDRSTVASRGRPTARWKCNLPVLRRSLVDSTIFFPEGYETDKRAFSFPLRKEIPVLSILGGDSPIGGDRGLQAMWPQLAANLEQHVVPGATHTVFFDKPEETASLIMKFLYRIKVLKKHTF